MSSNSINQVKIKKLDGTYDARNLSVNYDNVDGLSDVVPVPTVYDSDKFLKGDGTWGKVSKGVSYGTSPTAADVASKVVTSAEGDFELEEGASINVKFTYGNTAATPTLNIDTLGNKLIKAYGTEAPSLWWNAGDIVNFVYDGTNFIMRPTEGQINEINTGLSNKQNSTDNTLTTTSKTVVGAINEVNIGLSNKQNSTDNNLNTTSKTVVGAINEVNTGLSNKVSKSGDTLTGNLTIGSENKQNLHYDVLDYNGNTLRHKVWMGYANSGGDFYLYDNTTNKAIIKQGISGNANFDGVDVKSLKDNVTSNKEIMKGGTSSGNLTSGGYSDCNAITQTCTIHGNDTSISNMPTNGVGRWWTIITYVHTNNSDYLNQIAIDLFDPKLMYARVKNSGSWGSWTRIGSSMSVSGTTLNISL